MPRIMPPNPTKMPMMAQTRKALPPVLLLLLNRPLATMLLPTALEKAKRPLG